MGTPVVFVDASFLVALADAASALHPDARRCYTELLAGVRSGDVHLVSHATAIGAASERLAGAGAVDVTASTFADLVAVVDVEPVHGDLLRLARGVLATRDELHLVQAVTLAMLDRRRIRTIATFDPLFDEFDLTVLPGG